MEHHRKTTGDEYLPVVYPLVFHTGKGVINQSTDLFSLFGKQHKLAKEIFYKPYQLINLQEIPDDEGIPLS